VCGGVSGSLSDAVHRPTLPLSGRPRPISVELGNWTALTPEDIDLLIIGEISSCAEAKRLQLTCIDGEQISGQWSTEKPGNNIEARKCPSTKGLIDFACLWYIHGVLPLCRGEVNSRITLNITFLNQESNRTVCHLNY
jgi:hypothetical protein